MRCHGRHRHPVVIMQTTNEYQHTQIGYGLAVAYTAVVLVFAYLSLVTDFNPFVLAGLVIMLIVLASLPVLTTTISDGALKIQFGFGVIRKRFRLAEIQAYRVVKNRWYYGWGIKYTPHGWLFNVAGFSAIELEMTNGKTYRIGTDDPEGLETALSRALSHPPAC